MNDGDGRWPDDPQLERMAEHIADDVVDGYVGSPVNAHKPVEIALREVALQAARRGLGLGD